MKTLKARNEYLFFSFIIIVLFITYSRLIISDSLLDYDDKLLINPLLKIKNIRDYFNFVLTGKILDLQPIRDLSYLFDIQIKKKFSNYSYHFTNLLIWFLSLIESYRILKFFNRNYLIRFLLISLLAFNPLTAVSVSWIAARKHLLAYFFILIATRYFLQYFKKLRLKHIIFICLNYLLSCLSQPLLVFWPLSVVFYYYIKKIKINFKLLLPLFFIAIVIISLNLYYYSHNYLLASMGVSKFVSTLENPIGYLLLEIGRYLYQLLNPFSVLPTPHYTGSFQNLLGIIILAILIFSIYRIILSKKLTLLYPIFIFFLALAPVTIQTTNVFAMDSYLLLPLFSFFILLAILIKKINKNVLFFSILLLLFFILFTFNFNQIYLSDKKLWTFSHSHEATPQSTRIMAMNYLEEGNIAEAYKLASRLKEWNHDDPYLTLIFSQIYFKNVKLSTKNKISLINALEPQTASSSFYKMFLYDQMGEKDNVFNEIRKTFQNQSTLKLEFGSNEIRIFAFSYLFCLKHKGEKCKEDLNIFLNKKIKQEEWSKKEFDTEYNKLISL